MLNNLQIQSLKPADRVYRKYDTQSLYLELHPNGSKLWRWKYRFDGKEKRLALGKYPMVSLREAREARDNAIRLRDQGIDPSTHRRERLVSQSQAEEESFAFVAEEWFASRKGYWAASTEKKRRSLLNNDLIPYLGQLHMPDITGRILAKTVLRIESRGASETARNACNVLHQISAYAKHVGIIEVTPSSDLTKCLAPKREQHHPAIIEPDKLGKLMADIYAYKGSQIIRTALALSPLLFQRPGEICSMEWAELDLEKGLWIIPASKKKERNTRSQDHMVPLSAQALALLADLYALTGKRRYVFSNQRDPSKHIVTESLNKALRNLGYNTRTQHTAHGFRATARTILEENLDFPIAIIEQQLGHMVRDHQGRAYNRTKHLDKRSKMMQEWADYLDVLCEKHWRPLVR